MLTTFGFGAKAGAVLTPTELFGRTAGAVPYLVLCMLTLGALGLFFSTLADSPLAAALGELAVVVTGAVLLPLDAAAGVRTFLPTRTGWPGSTSTATPSCG